jgi:hypothetical protein
MRDPPMRCPILSTRGGLGQGSRGARAVPARLVAGVPGEQAFIDGAAPLENYVSGSGIAQRTSALLSRAVSAREAFALAASVPEVRIAAFGHDAALQGAIVAAADALTTR